jgi:sugar lactone lactonase YvrE
MERIVDSKDRLGECPLWDGTALWWTDIHGKLIQRFDGRLASYAMPEPVGSIGLMSGGWLLAAMQTGIYAWNNGQLRLLASNPRPDHRFNDGRCDSKGRFWVGTLKDPEFTATGSLYRYDGKLKPIKNQISVPNSLAWSPDAKTMYFADSPRHKIFAFDYDAESGEATNERLFAAPHPGFPDGSCVDADGCLWNAEYGAGRVVRYTPQGKVDRVIEVPAKAPTCCCFGGARLDTLYITSANGAGVWATRPGVTGLPEARFSG